MNETQTIAVATIFAAIISAGVANKTAIYVAKQQVEVNLKIDTAGLERRLKRFLLNCKFSSRELKESVERATREEKADINFIQIVQNLSLLEKDLIVADDIYSKLELFSGDYPVITKTLDLIDDIEEFVFEFKIDINRIESDKYYSFNSYYVDRVEEISERCSKLYYDKRLIEFQLRK